MNHKPLWILTLVHGYTEIFSIDLLFHCSPTNCIFIWYSQFWINIFQKPTFFKSKNNSNGSEFRFANAFVGCNGKKECDSRKIFFRGMTIILTSARVTFGDIDVDDTKFWWQFLDVGDIFGPVFWLCPVKLPHGP